MAWQQLDPSCPIAQDILVSITSQHSPPSSRRHADGATSPFQLDSPSLQPAIQPSQPPYTPLDFFARSADHRRLFCHKFTALDDAGCWLHERLLFRTIFGAAFLARHAQSARRVVIKVSLKAHAKDHQACWLAPEHAHVSEDAAGEAMLQQLLVEHGLHKFLMASISSFEDTKYSYHITDFAPLGDLIVYMQKNQFSRLPEDRVRALLGNVAVGLSGMHELGVAHGDIAPENLVLVGQEDARIIDFGLAQIMADSRLRATMGDSGGADVLLRSYLSSQRRRGRPGSQSPESYSGEECDPRAGDVWAFGIMIYLLLTGVHPAGNEHANGQHFPRLLHRINHDPLLIAAAVSVEAHALLAAIFRSQKDRISMRQLADHPFFTRKPAQLSRGASA